MHWLERAPRTFQPTKTFSFRHSSLMSKPTGRGNVRPSLVSIIQTQGGQAAHPSIENPFGFPLPVAGAIIISEEVVKEGHLVKNLKRRLFTLSIDSDNFPCLSYSDPKSKVEVDKPDDEKGHVRLVRGTTVGPTKKVRDVFSACLRIDVPQDPPSSKVDGHVKLVMCFVEARGMEMWTAALKWAMEFDSIVNRHNLAVADEEYAKLKPPVADEPLIARLPAVASPITPRQFSLARDSLTIPLDDDVLQQLREERGRLQVKVTPPQSPLSILDIVRVTNKDALKRIAHLESSLAADIMSVTAMQQPKQRSAGYLY